MVFDSQPDKVTEEHPSLLRIISKGCIFFRNDLADFSEENWTLFAQHLDQKLSRKLGKQS